MVVMTAHGGVGGNGAQQGSPQTPAPPWTLQWEVAGGGECFERPVRESTGGLPI